jgi:tight adherence protein B
MAGPLLFALFVAVSVFMAFVALWRLTDRADPIEARLKEYGVSGELAVAAPPVGGRGRAPGGMGGFSLGRSSLGAGLAELLTRADVPMTAAEYALIILGAALLGLLLGWWRLGILIGLVFALTFAYLPIFYLRRRESRRRQHFTEQLPDILSLLVGSLRAGHGLNQALERVAGQVPPPAAVEFTRLIRAVSLGVPVQQGLNDMTHRVGSDDLDLIVTAMNVQFEMGGNLAQTLDTIGDTIRDRIRIKREIQVMTSQQRLSGIILVAIPPALVVMMSIINPEYMSRLFDPGITRILLVLAILSQVLGILIMRRILDIEV